MTLSANQGSKVIVQEINLSQVITSTSTSVAAQIFVAKQGAPFPMQFTNGQDCMDYYGIPDAQVSFDMYCALDYFKEGNNLWGLRVVGAGALYSALLMYTDGTDTLLLPIPVGVIDPLEPNWPAYLPPGNNTAIALFYPNKGPGSYGDSLAISIASANLNTPTGLLAASSSIGGILPAATYEYQIASLSSVGETLATAPVQVVIAGPQVTNSILLTWTPDPRAIGYNVYGRTATGIGFLATVGAGINGFTDTGVIVPDTTTLPITSPANVTTSPVFQVDVFDTSQSTVYPVEQFNCTLDEYMDASGVECELEQRINPFSSYIQVTSNVPALMNVPSIQSAPATNMDGGDSGAAPTSYDIAGAWNTFGNKQLYGINLMINGGHADPAVQLAMDTLAQQRGDTISMIDVPSVAQKFQQAINYRRLQLNLNSTYSALFCPDVLEADTINGKQQYVPFSGWAAALCARTDRVANPSFSIAGLNRGLVNVLKSRYTYDQGQMDALFQAQVNYTQTFVGQGIALWEQQTLAAQMSALSWVSVRRIVNVIKTSLYNFLLYSLQEPNDDYLGRQIVQSCSDYLQAIQNVRGLSQYTVVSDATNNSAQDFNSGIRNVDVVLVPVIPVHIINLRVTISKQGVGFTEVLSTVAGMPS